MAGLQQGWAVVVGIIDSIGSNSIDGGGKTWPIEITRGRKGRPLRDLACWLILVNQSYPSVESVGSLKTHCVWSRDVGRREKIADGQVGELGRFEGGAMCVCVVCVQAAALGPSRCFTRPHPTNWPGGWTRHGNRSVAERTHIKLEHAQAQAY